MSGCAVFERPLHDASGTRAVQVVHAALSHVERNRGGRDGQTERPMQVLVGDLGPGFALRRQNLLTEPVYILNLTQVAYLLIECNCFPALHHLLILLQ